MPARSTYLAFVHAEQAVALPQLLQQREDPPGPFHASSTVRDVHRFCTKSPEISCQSVAGSKWLSELLLHSKQVPSLQCARQVDCTILRLIQPKQNLRS